MYVRTRPRAGAATTGIAIAGIAAVAATTLAPVAEPLTSAARDVRLAATEVPPGGLLTSFLGNQVSYCSAICPPLINTGVTAVVTTLQSPLAFVAAVQSNDIVKAIGITAASVTGPTNAALGEAIDADTTVAVPKASNAFEVAVISLLDIVPAAAGGLPAIGDAIAAAREETFEALNLPIPVTGPTVTPNGVVQVATLGAIRVGEAVVFPAFNEALQATVGVPDAAAQELAVSGDPARAAVAGADAAVGSASAAVNVVARSVVTAADDIRNAIRVTQKSSATTTSANLGVKPSRKVVTAGRHTDAEPGSRPLRNVASTVRQAARNVVKRGASLAAAGRT
ncbi:hypothetical protein [Mycolicibacterium stellerae]|uniref:hypothetical protein n=1 Tax=Mycolicibacterium stellerae TaxID=2358193 RepID=UPI0013DDE35C|nr:hypothetical protein [Mycolicibacterium stellerae]